MRPRASFAAAFLAVAVAGAGVALAQGVAILAIDVFDSHPAPARPTARIDNIRDVQRAFWRCWSPPPLDETVRQVNLTFQVTYKRDGALLGKPGPIAFAREITEHERAVYFQAVAETIERCSDMPFTDSMGGAVAGRWFRIAIIDKRRSKQTENSWLTTKTF